LENPDPSFQKKGRRSNDYLAREYWRDLGKAEYYTICIKSFYRWFGYIVKSSYIVI